ncbi:MAG: prepilin peptidase [Alphaproteobacteria bacterium]|nr:prepilin peptidase [Alphaproteobacteria bacterium]
MMISIKDLKDGIIPNILLVMMALLGLLQFGYSHGMTVVILGSLSYGLYKFYPLLKNKEWLGFGDVKMMMVSGLWLDISQIPLFLVAGGGMGVGMAIFWQALRKERCFPFAPALAFALGLCILGDNGLSIGENKMTTFTAHSLPPASGLKPDSIVVLIHGYGANGKDLLALGDTWSTLLPNTLFIAPDGPDQSAHNPFGNQWFGLSDWDPTQKLTKEQVSQMMVEIQELTPSFNQYLDGLLHLHGLPHEKLALVGFSQGAMLALHIGLHRPLCGGVIAYSGAFLEDLKEVKVSYPSVLLVHGTDDQVLSPVFSQVAKGRLESLGTSVTLSILPGLGHGIDERGLDIGGAFLKENLYKIPQADLSERAKASNS